MKDDATVEVQIDGTGVLSNTVPVVLLAQCTGTVVGRSVGAPR
jgi:hypothetical protein